MPGIFTGLVKIRGCGFVSAKDIIVECSAFTIRLPVEV